MKCLFKAGDIKQYEKIVRQEDIAKFDGEVVHEVYSTFALARDAEWTCRLFVLDMKEEDEEGIGTMICLSHRHPATVGTKVIFTAVFRQLVNNVLLCEFEAKAGNVLIAKGKQEQRILKKKKLQQLLTRNTRQNNDQNN